MRTRGGLPVRRWRARILALRLGLLLAVGVPALYWGWLPASVAVAVAAVLICSLVPQRLGSAVAAHRAELARLDRRIARAKHSWEKDRHVSDFWRRQADYADLVGRRDPAERERLLRTAMAEGSTIAFSWLVDLLRERDLTDLVDDAYRTRPGLALQHLEILNDKGLPRAALHLARKTLADGFGEAPFHVIRLLVAEARLDDAVTIWRNLPAKAGYPSASTHVGSALRAAGRSEDALEVLWTEYERTGNIPYDLPELVVEAGRAEEAERRWLAGIDGRNGKWARFMLRRLYLATNRPAEADAINPPPPPGRRPSPRPEPVDDRDYFSPFMDW